MMRIDARPRRAERRGAVMVVMLLSLFLLAGLVFWVINLGQHVNDRMSAQHAADATAAGGAGWMARSMNTIAANNVQMARLLAAVAVMDGMDEAVQLSLREQTVLLEKLETHLAAGSLSTEPMLDELVARLLNETADEMADHVEELESTAAAMERSGVARAASYEANGRLWRAIDAADAMNVALVERMDDAVRSAAETGGEANLADAEGAAVTLLPLEVKAPMRRGRFDDFERPVLDGLLPAAEDDRHHARGPWDVLLGWRDRLGHWVERGEIEGRSRVAHVPREGKNVPVTRLAVEHARAAEAHFEAKGYRTYGPLEWMLRRVRKHAVRRLGSTRLDWYAQRLTEMKIDRVWPRQETAQARRDAGLVSGGGDEGIGRYKLWGEDRPVVEPDWRTDYGEAQQIARQDPDRIKETAFFVVEIKSRFPPGHPQFLAEGTWTEVSDDHAGERRLVIEPGWEDPQQWRNAELVRQWAWEDTWQYEVYFDSDVGVEPARNGEGRLVGQPVYRVDHVAFAGVNVGEEAGIRDPFAGLSREDGPAPMRLDSEAVGHDDAAARRAHLSVLGVVRRPSEAAVWGERFVGGGPTGDTLAIAQARLFNHHSWDLWTQTWRAELEAVSDFDRWVAGMRGQTMDDETQRVYRHLNALEPLAPVMLTH